MRRGVMLLVGAFAILGCRADGDGWKARFARLDRDGNGVLTQDEVNRPAAFRRADRNGDGRVTMAEAEELAHERRSQRRQGALADEDAAISKPQAALENPISVPYASKPGVDPNLLSLDIYRPSPSPAAPAPVIVMVHGGGWQAGDKANPNLGPRKADFFNARGFVYVSVNYRLSPAVRHPAHAEDVAAALGWIFAHIREYGGDPGRIFLMGHSAGAHLAALVTTDPHYLAAHGLSPDQIRGVALLDSAGYDIPKAMQGPAGPLARSLYETAFGTDPAVWRAASPLAYVKAGRSYPRFLVLYTARPESEAASKEFVASLRQAGVPAFAALAVGKTHGSLNAGIGEKGDAPTRAILDFFAGKNSFSDRL